MADVGLVLMAHVASAIIVKLSKSHPKLSDLRRQVPPKKLEVISYVWVPPNNVPT